MSGLPGSGHRANEQQDCSRSAGLPIQMERCCGRQEAWVDASGPDPAGSLPLRGRGGATHGVTHFGGPYVEI